MASILCRRKSSGLVASRLLRGISSTQHGLPPYNILFCGSDEFAKSVITAIHAEKGLWSSIFVLTARDATNTKLERKRMPISPVKVWAEQNGLQSDTVPTSGIKSWTLPPQFQETKANGKNLILTASFGQLIPEKMMNPFQPTQRLNLHPSLLPAFAGAAPIQWAIARHMFKTGVTVQTLGPRYDSGDIYAQEEVNIPLNATYESFEPILADVGARVLLQTLRDLRIAAAKSRPQHGKNWTVPVAPKLKRKFSQINWKLWTAYDIEARSRAFGYLFPVWTTLRGDKGVMFRKITVLENLSSLSLPEAFTSSEEPGTAYYSKQAKALFIVCKKAESYLRVERIQTEGKKEFAAVDWINGYRDRCDSNGLLHFFWDDKALID